MSPDWPKVVVVGLMCLTLVSIVYINVVLSESSIPTQNTYTKQCIDEVSYIQGPSGMTVEYQPDGTIKLCK